ncbi:hypothetical protein FPV67DRAFT_183060 [Lyophyllum atratum]|nr:hypothetical protein FPV67DRAFT_183060 [Lyophyllum atratum]
MFCGRGDLVGEASHLLLAFRHVALIGPGGIGKTSVARAVLNDDAIIERFSKRRYFVTYDDIDASQITYTTFLDRIARALGLPLSKANTLSLITRHLSISQSLLVLDNGETFLEAGDGGRIAECFERFISRPNVAILLTTRLIGLPPNLEWERLQVPALDLNAASEAFEKIYRSPIEPSTLRNILSAIDCHPLSINLLAQVAVQNQWSSPELLAEWDYRHVWLLENGNGKVQSLAVTIEMTLNSPSIKKLGDIVRHMIQLIALLPQGLNKKRSAEMFPSNPTIARCSETLCKHSLAYLKNGFITFLAPVRLYIAEQYNHVGLFQIPFFAQVSTYYRTQLNDTALRKKLVWEEDINIEHVLVLDLANCSKKDKKDMDEALELVITFLDSLEGPKLRSTALLPAVLALNLDPTPQFWASWHAIRGGKLMKMKCLTRIGRVASDAGQFAEAIAAVKEAREICLTSGTLGDVWLVQCDVDLGGLYYATGDYTRADRIYEEAIQRPPVLRLFKTPLDHIPEITFKLERARILAIRGESGALELALAALAVFRTKVIFGIERLSKLEASLKAYDIMGYAELWAGNSQSARKYFETALSDSGESNSHNDHLLRALVGMVDVSYCEDNESESIQRRRRVLKSIDSWKTHDTIAAVRALTVLAAHIAVHGDVHQAREDIGVLTKKYTQSLDIDTRAVISLYVAACIELLCEDLSAAAELLMQTIEYAEALSEVRVHAQALAALGEVAVRWDDMDAATVRFEQAREHCDFMGVKVGRRSVGICWLMYKYVLAGRDIDISILPRDPPNITTKKKLR